MKSLAKPFQTDTDTQEDTCKESQVMTFKVTFKQTVKNLKLSQKNYINPE